MDLGVKDLRVLVTAGAGGIGLEIARAFVRAGAKVHIGDVDEKALGAAKKSDPQLTQTVCVAPGGWKLLFLDGKMLAPDPARDDAHNRGAYLVEAPGHCAECHSPRNSLGAIKPSGRFAGGADLEGEGWVPNITPHADGLAEWSAKDIEYFLETGLTPDGYAVESSMADVVKNTAKLSAADRAAMAAYLKALPPREGKRPPRKSGELAR